MQKEMGNWYASWFSTPYYHMLYRDRDIREAGSFMDNLAGLLGLAPGASILDLACGRGRHAIHLEEMGFDVTGVDLSSNNIDIAKKYESENLKFHIHDMREPFGGKFDAVFNLFTSFGYFRDERDNLRTIKAIKKDLKSDGYGVIDFLNVDYIADRLIPEEEKVIDGIVFKISRNIEDGFIIKDIQFNADGENHHFRERVQSIRLEDFRRYFKLLDVELLHCLGSYELEPFDSRLSERLILIFS